MAQQQLQRELGQAVITDVHVCERAAGLLHRTQELYELQVPDRLVLDVQAPEERHHLNTLNCWLELPLELREVRAVRGEPLGDVGGAIEAPATGRRVFLDVT